MRMAGAPLVASSFGVHVRNRTIFLQSSLSKDWEICLVQKAQIQWAGSLVQTVFLQPDLELTHGTLSLTLSLRWLLLRRGYRIFD